MLRTIDIAVTVFGCGWVLMGLEILGGRMLTPHFGGGVEVWGSIIGVFMAALSVGYFLGGWLSRWWPSGWGLAAVILLAGAWLVPLAFWHQSVSHAVLDLDLEDRWGSLVAATALFFAPSALLGVVSPYAVRLTARRVETVGVSAGTLYAISTAGSFAGCLVTAFHLITWAGIKSILLGSAACLAAIAALLAITWFLGRPKKGSELFSDLRDGPGQTLMDAGRGGKQF